MPKVPAAYREVVAAQRARMNRLIDRRGVAAVKEVYDVAVDELGRRLSRVARPGTMTAGQARALMSQARAAGADISRRLAGALGDASLEAQREALEALASDIAKLEREFTGATVDLPIEEAARFRGLIDKRRTSLMRAHKTSMARYGAHVVKKVEDQISRSLLAGETGREAVARVAKAADVEWWAAERVVRTEIAWAQNAAHADGIGESAQELSGLMMRWSEHVDDATYEPFDDRVGVDSVAMHGQLAKPGGVFTMPPTTARGREVPDALVGESWGHPPNRPNDRAVLSPWRPGWGVPGWVWRAGRRVTMR